MKRFAIALAVMGAVLLVLAALMLWLSPRLLNQQWLKSRVAAHFSARIGGQLSFERVEMAFIPRLRVMVSECRVWVPGVVRGELPEATLYPRLAPLLIGSLQPAAVHLLAPEAVLQLPESGPQAQGLQAFWPVPPAAVALPFKLTIVRGRLELSRGGRSLLQLTELDLEIDAPHERPRFKLQCRSSLWQRLVAAGETPSGEEGLRGHADITGFNPSLLLQTVAPATAACLQVAPIDLSAAFAAAPGSGLRASLQSPRLGASLTGPTGQAAFEGDDVGLSVALNDAGLEIGLDSLRLAAPAAVLSGRLHLARGAPRVTLAMAGREVDLSAVRQVLQSLAGDNPVLRKVLSIVRGGRVPAAHWESSGNTLRDLIRWENFSARAQLADGRVFVPKPGLDLSEVAGAVLIAEGRLTGSGLQARLGNSVGRDGALYLGLSPAADAPFALDIQVAADLAQLPPVLQQIGGHPVYLAELARLDSVSGQGRGRLKLEGRPGGMQVAVAVTEFSLEADYQRLPARVSLSGGTFFFDSNAVQVAGLGGKMGNTTLKGLSARLGRRPPYPLEITSLEGRVALAELSPWLLGFAALQQPIGRLAPLAGGLELAALSLTGPLLAPDRWRFQAAGRLAGVTAGAELLGAPLGVATGRFQAQNGRLQFDDAALSYEDARLTAAGSLLGFPGPVAAIDLTVDGVLHPVSAARLLERLGVPAGIGVRTPLKVANGLLEWRATGAIGFSGSLSLANGPSVDLEVRRDERKQLVQQFSIRDGERLATMRLGLAEGVASIDFAGYLERATLDRLIIGDNLPSGWLRGEFNARIPLAAPLAASASGRLAGEHIVLPGPLAGPLIIHAIALEGRGESLQIAAADLTWNRQRFQLQGSVSRREERLLADLEASAGRIDADQFLSAAASAGWPGLTPVAEGAKAKPWPMLAGRLGVHVAALTLGGRTWQPLSAEVSFDGRQVEVALQDAALCGIGTDGFVTLTPRDVRVDLKATADDGVLQDALDCLWGRQDLMDGRFDLQGSLFGAGPAADLRGQLRGPFRLQARDGRIYRFNLLSKIFSLLNITEIYRGELPDLVGEGFAYSRIDAAVQLEGGRLVIEEAVLDAPSMKIVCAGNVDLIAKQMDLTFIVAPLKTVDRILAWVPMVSHVLEGSLISFPVRATGDLRDPTLVPLSPAAVGAGLFGILKNIIKLPVTLIDLLNPGGEAED
jgi:hypothetical protein